MKKGNNGFTLMELLIVIFIITLLTGVVMAYMQNAHNKGSDAGAQRDLITIRNQASLFYTSNYGSYGTSANTCAAAAGTLFNDPQIKAAIAHATVNSNQIACNSTSQTFAVAIKLKMGNFYCVDSNNTGKVNKTATLLSGGSGSSYVIDSTTGLCN